MWGKTKFAFGKYEKEKMSYKTVFEKDPSYVSWCRKHLTKDSAKGPALDWSRYIKARDLVDCKVANVPFYAGTTLRREFCDWWHDGLQLYMEWSSSQKGVWKFLTSVVRWIHLVFLHWKKWICFSPWWWAQPWWLTLYLHVSHTARFIGDDETQQLCFSSSLSTLIARRTQWGFEFV